jgi:hypothetical protein
MTSRSFGEKSELGQSRPSDRAQITSGLPREADVFGVGRHFSRVPRTEVASYSVISSADEQAGKRETSSLPAG